MAIVNIRIACEHKRKTFKKIIYVFSKHKCNENYFLFKNDMEAAREAYDAFLSHYPYCYGYWRKYADYEKRKGNKKKCEEVGQKLMCNIMLYTLT